MRRLILAGAIVLLGAAGGGAAGWHWLRPHDRLAEAQQKLAHGELRAAQLILRRAVQADPARAAAHVQLGRVQLLLGDPAAAEHEFRTAGDRGWDRQALRPLLAQAVVAQADRDRDRNEAVLRDYSPDGLAPEQAASVLVARAQAQFALQRPAEAAASIAAAQRLAPASLETSLGAARLAAASGDLAAAQRHVTAALAIDPHALPALQLQAALQQQRGDRTAALASYGAAIDQAGRGGAPGTAEQLRLQRAELLAAMGEAAAARADLDLVLQAQPKQPYAQLLSARLFAQAADWKDAEAALSAIGPGLSELPQGDLTLAAVKAGLGEPEQAIAAAERQVTRTPGDLAAVRLLARLELAARQPERAAAVLAAAAAAGHTLDAAALDLLGTAYAEARQPGQAMAALQQEAALAPDDSRLLTRLAALELQQGEAPKAEQALAHVLAAVAPDAAAPPARLASLQGGATVTPMPPAAPAPPAPSPAQTAAALVQAALRAGDIDGAVSALERLRQAHGDPAQLATLTGLVKLAQVDLDGARAAFEEAVRLAPQVPAARINLARVQALAGHAGQAIAGLHELLAREPANAAALTALVNLQLAAGRRDEALAAAEAAHRAAPGDPGITAGLAGLYLRAQQPQKALDLLAPPAAAAQAGDAKPGDAKPGDAKPGDAKPGDAKSVDATIAEAKPAGAKPAEAKALLLPLRAQAQLALGQRDAAIQTLRGQLEQTPDNAALRRQIAELLAADKQFDDAHGLLREGLARRPGDLTLLVASIAVARAEGGVEAALARIDELAQDPANAAVYVLKGDLLLGEHRFAAAQAAYQARVAALPADDPQAAALQVRAAQAAAAGGDPAAAAALLRDWLAAHPQDAAAGLALASFDIAANRLPEARTRLEAVLASQPTNAAALNNLAWVSQQQGDLAHARALATRAYLLGPSPQSADTLAWIVLAQGHAPEALALLREAARARPGDPAIQYHLAAALARDGQKDAAVAVLKPLLEKPPAGFGEQPEAAKLLAELTG